MLFSAFLALVPLVAFAGRTEANPMRKIITMLQDMAKELEREGEVEKEIFDKAACACENGEGSLDQVISESSAAIEEFTSKIESETAEQAGLGGEITEHKANVESATKDLGEATMLREKDVKKFTATEKDTKSNLAGLSKAIPAIEKGMGGAALMQMPSAPRLRRMVEVSKYISSDDRTGVLAFLDQGEDEGESVQAPQSGEILGILKNMKDEMQRDLADMQAQENTDRENFDDLSASKKDEIAINEKAVIDKDKRTGALALSLSEGKHALEDAQEELADAQTFKANMKEQCARMEGDRAMRTKMRNDEILAVSEAVKILNDDDALAVFSAAKPGAALVQQGRHTFDAFVQVETKRVSLSLKRQPAGVAEHANAAEGLVKNMIDGMVGVLHDDDVGDEHKKGWCSNETEVAHAIEAQKQTVIEQTTAEITQMDDDVATLTTEIKDTGARINALDKMVHEATTNRKTEHQEFVDSFATMATAIRLLDKAIIRLEKFYSPEKHAKAAKAATDAALAASGLALLARNKKPSAKAVAKMTNSLLPGGFDAFLQTSTETTSMARFRADIKNGVDPIAIPTTPGTYVKKESGGVMGLMTEFKSDLKTDMTEQETEEKFNAKDYTRIMNDAQVSRAQEVKSLSDKKFAKATLDEKLVMANELKTATDKELHNLQLYLAQLHAECDFLVRNYENRHEGRVSEETGLESAKTIVTDEEPPSHEQITKRYKEEDTDAEVDENFAGTIVDGRPKQ